ncbi:MAG: HIT family protein [Candidatus Hydrothermarchaeota archaeon]|nr:MAG: HIT family protein [Candidatus Hydrothermarchaeota archaeon]
MCIFCKIVNKEIPAKIIYEDDEIMAFLDINPRNEGHTLVIPKKHYDNLLEAPDNTLAEMMRVAKLLCQRMKNKLNAKGFNIVINVEKVAGQEINHLHLHIVPRYAEDGEVISFGEVKEVELNGVYEKLKT